MLITKRKTCGESGPLSTRSPTKIAFLFSGANYLKSKILNYWLQLDLFHSPSFNSKFLQLIKTSVNISNNVETDLFRVFYRCISFSLLMSRTAFNFINRFENINLSEILHASNFLLIFSVVDAC
jgi:hypothetical protein